MYKFNPFAIPPLITAIFCFFIGAFIFLKNRRSQANISFAVLSLSCFVWNIGYFMAYLSISETIAYYWCRIAYLGISFITPATYHFSVVFIGLKKQTFFVYVFYIMGIIFAALLKTDLIVSGAVLHFWGYHTKIGVLHNLFLVSWLIPLVLAFKNFRTGYKNAILPLERQRAKYMFWAVFFGYFGGIDYFAHYGINIYPIGFLPVILFIFSTAYAIVKYRLMDIKVAITRTGIFVAVYTLVLGLPFAIAVWFKSNLIAFLGGQWWIFPLGLMATLATVGPFIYIYLQRKAEERLLKEQRRYQMTLKQASVGMTRIRNLNKLLDLITHIVTKTVKISYAAIYLYNEKTGNYELQISRDKGRIPLAYLPADNPLVTWIILKREPLVYEDIKRLREDTRDATYAHLEENMRLLTAMVIIPSFLEDKFIGFFVLGDKVSGQIYTQDDLNVFRVLASQAALAIENAQFYDEAKEMQEQIAQAEKMATIGTMADGLSHQINNRFYALSLIAGDTIDTIKMTDTTKCTPEVREMIDSINHALERIQTNVIQGGQVVRGILKYTRKGDEGLEPLALDQVIDGTLEMVQYKVKLTEIDIARDYPKTTPKIKGNLVELQEVFFNFIDNAYDAIVERRVILKEPAYRGRISIAAQAKGPILEIIIADNGMGITDEDAQKVFTPFFTTKTSSRRGTGLGLYVIRRIITDTHKGKISFESTHKVGTRFIVELPLAA